MPVLFGNTYILPAIIVVVLLVLLLLVLVLRKRGSRLSASKTAGMPERRVTSPPKPTTVERAPLSVVPMTNASPAEGPGAETTVPWPGVTGPGVTEPGLTEPNLAESSSAANAAPPAIAPSAAARHEAVRIDMAPHADPLHAVVLDILQGWGDITDDDTTRLSLFRPEKVLSAVQTMDIPKELKSNQHARTRLTQLRQYAANRVDQRGEQHAVASSATAAVAEPEPTLVPVAPVVPPEPAFEATPEMVAEPQAPLVENDYADELSTWPEPAITAEPPVYPPFAVPVEAQTETPAEAPTEIPLEAPIETPAEVSLEAVQESPFEAAVVPATEPLASEIPSQGTSWLRNDAGTTPQWQSEGAPTFLEEPESSLSSLHGTVKTADELFALPAEERPDMVAFLEPAELSKVFDRADDPGLKRAIIDTLEHVSNPASLEVLRRCLDDPDPQIQLYALEAADRLLGVD